MKRILISFALLLAALSARGQVGEYRSDFAVGVSGGYVLNKVSFTPTIKQNFHTGYMGGLTLRYTSERYYGLMCAIQAEVNYAQLGWRELIETSEDTYERTLTYVQIPLLARLAFGREHRGVCGFLVLGPQVGYLIGDKDKRGGQWSNETLALRPNGIVEQYALPVQKKFEYGLTGGLGLEVNTKVGHFLLEGRYYYALSDIFNNAKGDAFSRSANGAIVAKVSYLIDLKKTKRQ